MGQDAYLVGGYGVDAGETDVDVLYDDNDIELVYYGDMVLGEDNGVLICIPGTTVDACLGEPIYPEKLRIPTQEEKDKLLSIIRGAGFEDLANKTPAMIFSSYYG